MKNMRLYSLVFVFLVGGLGSHAVEGDPFMGDWKGSMTPKGTDIVAQVIALGNGQYQANLLPEFDQRCTPLAVLEGIASGDQVTFTGKKWQGQIKGDCFTGEWKGSTPGTFKMTRMSRLSPTLGAKPPAGAIVLFDGSTLEPWQKADPNPWLLNLAKHLGGEHRVAYLRTQIWSPSQQKAVLEMGSDDGIKVWFNEKLIHALNTVRGVKPGEDKINIELSPGWNRLLLKVIQGEGGWGACARLASKTGKPLEGIKIASTPDSLDENKNAPSFEQAKGYLMAWEISGPYTKEGKEGSALFDVAFVPEQKSAPQTAWRPLPISWGPEKAGWKILSDGSMEVVPQSGTIHSKRQFADHRLHLEFRTPFLPDKRDQSRGNSGVYLQGRYEIQILDSYGLEGRDNECGGIYKVSIPRVNMCAPPLQWQTYDVTFIAPHFDSKGKKIRNARLTVLHNGVLIHKDLELPGPTGGAIPGGEPPEPGPLMLQDHGNLVQFRNIWAVELDRPE